jgi:rRNA maturation RNase YbeY
MIIRFFSDGVPFVLQNKKAIRQWLKVAGQSEGKVFQWLHFVFTTDRLLHRLNRQYLGHDEYTDVLTFDLSAPGRGKNKILCAEIYISLEQVRDNARKYGLRLADELHRVMIHGLLHLCGYSDKTEKQRKKMRAREDFYLKKLQTLTERK